MKRIICVFAALVAMLMANAGKTDELIWYSADSLPLYGTLAENASKAYSRLPDSLKNTVRKEVWDLGLNSAGLFVRFKSNASDIGLKWKSLNKFNMNHMTATGIRGLDLYAFDPTTKSWDFVASGRPDFNNHKSTVVAIEDMEPKMREYMLYLSLYDGVDSLYIGVDSLAVVERPSIDLPVRNKPVIMYGTSILQGGCATRPGMTHTNILGRKLNREVINLGFSGNGKLDPEIARLIAQSNPGVVVLDMLPNCTKELLEEKLIPFYEIIRASHPEVPILMVESPIFPVMKWNRETLATITEKNKTLKDIYAKLKAEDRNLHYFEGEKVLTNREGTVDNYHMTDLGFSEFADNIYPVIDALIKNSEQ